MKVSLRTIRTLFFSAPHIYRGQSQKTNSKEDKNPDGKKPRTESDLGTKTNTPGEPQARKPLQQKVNDTAKYPDRLMPT